MSEPFAAVDLGKSRCRLTVIRDAQRYRLEGDGAPGLATGGGIDAAEHAIGHLLARARVPIGVLGVGAAGALSAPDDAADLAARLAERTGAQVMVTSDVVTAHAGALEGRAGTLLIAGTGAVALGIDDAGMRLIDGWGPELGDFGSGSWLGREGVRSVLRAAAGIGRGTVLDGALRAHIRPAENAHAWLSDSQAVARQLATFAPVVLDSAHHGDAVACEIVDEAVRLLTVTASAASDRTHDVALHGGLLGNAWFRAELERSLTEAGRRTVPAAGDALDGALMLARDRERPHERYLHRAG